MDWIERKTHILARMKDGELASICSVIRDLASHRRVKKLNEFDKSTLNRAQSFLLTEWMHSLAVSQVQANNELMQLLGAV
jgi:RNA polymerase-interacting CarD/CdnL/TRCF family regulator